jgi:hypothetical protein
MFQEVAADPAAVPGVVLSVQNYGDSLNLHPHIHAIASRGVWSAEGSFEAIPALDSQQLMLLFRHHVIKNLLAAGRISQTAVDILDRFHHPGFSAYEGEGVSAGDSAARERLASYLVHAPFSLARLHYDRDSGTVTYDPRTSQCSCLNPPAPERFSPLDALAALTAFIPEKGLQLAIMDTIATRPAANAAVKTRLVPSLLCRLLAPTPRRTTISAVSADALGRASFAKCILSIR